MEGLYKEITVAMDEDCIEIFKKAAAEHGMNLDLFLQQAGLLALAKEQMSGVQLLSPQPPHKQEARRKRSVRQKKKYTAREEEQIFRDFTAYLNEELKRHSEETFACKYSICPDLTADWLPEEMRSGESAEENYRMELLCREKLLQAMESGDEALCLQVVQIAMDWGGVYYSRGVRKGNRKQVETLARSHELLNMVRRSYTHIQNRELEMLEYFTSGWSIIWYLLDMEGLFIVSSRKIYALNKVLRAYQQEYHLESLPVSLDLGQLVYQGSPRYLEGVRYIYTQKAKLVLLKKCVRILGAIKALGDFSCNRELDNLLFIMGEA